MNNNFKIHFHLTSVTIIFPSFLILKCNAVFVNFIFYFPFTISTLKSELKVPFQLVDKFLGVFWKMKMLRRMIPKKKRNEILTMPNQTRARELEKGRVEGSFEENMVYICKMFGIDDWDSYWGFWTSQGVKRQLTALNRIWYFTLGNPLPPGGVQWKACSSSLAAYLLFASFLPGRRKVKRSFFRKTYARHPGAGLMLAAVMRANAQTEAY